MQDCTVNTDIAVRCGVNAGIVYSFIERKILMDSAIKRVDGFSFCRITMNQFRNTIPFLTENQIRNAISKLQRAEFLNVSCLNDDPMDRTAWYAIDGVHSFWR